MSGLSNVNRNALKIEAMSPAERDAYLSTATRVTVGTISQVVRIDGANVFKTYYVAKIRGAIVGNSNEYKKDTYDEAMTYGLGILDRWRREYYQKLVKS
jgi:hypothetical protein